MSHPVSQQADTLKRSVRALLGRSPTALAMLGLPGLALAGPTGEEVIRGDADIHRPDTRNTVIDQHTDRAVINWQTFNVDADEFVLFNQPGASSMVLNRVLGGDMSRILGQMQANGQVFLLNPQGVFFADGASLDVQGFLGSTLDMDPDAFMAGDYTLARSNSSPSTASVINDGEIHAGPGGYVVLAGDFTENTGIITANAGTVALVSGNALALDIEGDGLVSFTVDEATLSENAGVRNAGSLIADGGMVVMTAKVANDLVATAVNNEGLVRARSVEERDGEIWLVGHGGDVSNYGALDADGENADGGQVMVWSDENVTLANGALQTANGALGHNGGDMRFIAQQQLDYQADNLISATGDIGGRVEVSGHGGLHIAGTPVLGPGGELFIDPDHIAIFGGTTAPALTSSNYTWAGPGSPTFYQNSESVTRIGTTWIGNQLTAGVDISLVASETITWDSSVSGAINIVGTGAGAGDLHLAIGSVSAGGVGGATVFGADINHGVFSGGTGVTVTPAAGIEAGIIDLTGLGGLNLGGNFTASIAGGVAGDAINLPDIAANNVTIDAGAGSVSVDAGGFNGITAGGDVTITAGTILNTYVNRANNVVFNGNVSGSNFHAGSSGTSSPSSSGNITTFTVNGNVNVSNAVWVHVAPSGSINVSGSINAGGAATFAAGINSASPSGTVSLGNGLSAGGNITLHAGTVDLTGQFLAPALITVSGNGSITGGNFSFGSSTTPADGVSVNGSVNNSGDVAMWTRDISNGDISITGNLITTGSVTLNAQGSSGATPGITIGGYASAGGNINMTAIGTSIGGGGSIAITSGAIAGGGIALNASAGGGSNGGNISIAGGGLSAGGLVSLTANGGTFAGGNITVVGAGPKGIAGNGITLSANGTGAASTQGNGSISINGQVQAGTGDVNISAINTGPGQGGNIAITGNGSGGQVRGQSVSITAGGSGTNGRIDLGQGIPESSFQGGTVIAQSGDLDLTVTNGTGVINAGQLVANGGNITITNNVGQGHVHIGDYSGGGATFIGGTITAGGNFLASISGSATRLDFGAISAGNALDINLIGGFSHGMGDLAAGGQLTVNASGNVTLGNVQGGTIDLTMPGTGLAVGNLDATTGGITVSGNYVQIADSSVTAAGAISVTNAGSGSYSYGNFSGSAVSISITGSGSMLNGTVGNITATAGNINLSASNTLGSAVLAAGALQAAGSITASAHATTSGLGGGDVTVGDATAAGGTIKLIASNASGNASITVLGNASAGNSFIADASAIGGSGTVTVNGDIKANTGTLSFSSNIGRISYGVGAHALLAGNNIVMNNNTNLQLGGSAGSVDYSAGGNISIRLADVLRARDINAGGTLDVQTFRSGINSAGNITAGHVNMHFAGSDTSNNVTVNLGNVHATGATGDVVISIDEAGGAYNSLGAINVTSAVADNGDVSLDAYEGGSGTYSGGISVSNGISAGGLVKIVSPGDVSVAGLVRGSNGVTIGATDTGMSTGADVTVGGIDAGTGVASISANDGGLGGTGGNIRVTTSGVHGDAGVNLVAGNVAGSATIEVNGTILTPGIASITASGGVVGNEFVVDTSAGGVAGLTMNGGIALDSTATGDVVIWATNGGNVSITGGIDAAGNNVNIHAGGTAANVGNISISGPISGGAVNLAAQGGSNGGNINIGSGSAPFNGAAITASTGALSLSAQGGDNGGNIAAGVLSAASNINVTATGGLGDAGNIRIGNHSGGVVTSGDTITAGSAVSITQSALSSSGARLQAGMITTGTDLSLNVSGPGAFDYTALPFSIGGAFAFVGSGGATYSFGSLTATNIEIGATPVTSGSATITTTDLVASGTGSFSGNVKVGIAAGSNSGGSVNVGNVSAQNDAYITVGGFPRNAGGGNVNAGSVTAPDLVRIWAPDVTTGAITSGNNVGVYGENAVTINGNLGATGNITIEAMGSGAGHITISASSITGDTIMMTASGSSGRIDVGVGAAPESNFTGADISAGNVGLSATGTNSGGGVVNVGSITATTGGVGINVSGGAGGGHIHVGDYTSGFYSAGDISGVASISILAGSNGAGVLSSGALIDVGNVSNTSGAIVLTANANNGAGTGAINGGVINAGNVNAGNNINMNATGALNGGNINFGNASGTGMILNASGGSAGGNINGSIATGTGASGDVQFNAYGVGGTGSGSVTLTSVTSQRDLSIWTTNGDIATGTLSAAGFVDVNAQGDGTHSFGNITGAGMHLRFQPDANGTVNVTTGVLTANGTGSASRHVALVIDSGFGTASSASVNIAGANAVNGDVALHLAGIPGGALNASGNISAAREASLAAGNTINISNVSAGRINLDAGSVTAGNLTASGLAGSSMESVFVGAKSGASLGSINAEMIDIQAMNGNVVTGSLSAINASDAAGIHISTNNGGAGGSITVNGTMTVSGQGGSGNGADVYLDAGSTGGFNVTVNGSINVNATAIAFSNTYSNGTTGRAGFSARAESGTVTLGDVTVNGVGGAYVDVTGIGITVGNLNVNAADGTFAQTVNYTSSMCGTTCSFTQTQTMNGGQANVFLGNSSSGATGALSYGSINVTGGTAHVYARDFATISGGTINVTGTGSSYTQASTGTYAGNALNYSASSAGGGANAWLMASSAGTVNISGAVTISGRGFNQAYVLGNNISLASVDVSASAGTFTRSGEPGPMHYGSGSGPFEYGLDAGPRIDAGTVTGGGAAVYIGGRTSSSSATSEIYAADVNVAGNLSVSAPGTARIGVAGNSIAVSGTLTATGGFMTQNGTRTEDYTASNGDSMHSEATIATSYGEAGIDLHGSSGGTISAGAITAVGPDAYASVEGGNINLANVTLTGSGSGGNIDMVETVDNLTAGTSEDFEFHGPGLLSGMRIEGTGTVNAGALVLDADGAGGLMVGGNNVNVQDVTVNVTDASYQVLDGDAFGSSMHSFSLGDALLDISATSSATVNGNVSVNAGQTAHLAGTYDVTGTLDVTAGGAFTRALSDELRYLDAVGNEGGEAPLATSGPLSVNAAAIGIDAAGGGVSLLNSTLTATGAIDIVSGISVNMSNAALSAGGAVTMNAAGAISNAGSTGAISADALLLQAGGNIALANTVMMVGAGSTGFAGDATAVSYAGLASGSNPSAAFVSGGILRLGDVTVSGDYIYMQANAFVGPTALSLPSGGLLQVLPGSTSADFALGGGPGGSAATAMDTSALSGLAGATVVFGGTGFTGDIKVGNPAPVDFSGNDVVLLTLGGVSGNEQIAANNLVIDASTVNGLMTSAASLTLNNVTSADFDLVNGGTLDITGANIDALQASFGGTAALVGGFTGTNLALSTTGSLEVGGGDYAVSGAAVLNVDGTLTLNGGLSAGTLTASGSGTLDLSGQVVDVAGDATINLGGDLLLSGTSLAAGTLLVDVDGDVRNGVVPGSIDADAAAIIAGGDIVLGDTTMTIGSDALAAISGDSRLLSLLSGEGLAPASAGPNLYMSANSITLGNLVFNGDYLFVKADNLAFAGAITASRPDALVQLAPLTATNTVSLVDTGTGTGSVNFSNSEHLSPFGGLTLALGTTAHQGDVVIAEDGTVIDIGDSNLFVLTNGAVTGLDSVLSTGVVKDLNALLGLGFDTPQTEEIDSSQDTVQTLSDDFALEGQGGSDEEEEGDEEGEDTDTDADVEEDDDSLIRQSTSDEEMMCR